MSLTASLRVRLKADEIGSPDLGQAAFSLDQMFETLFANGAGANQANLVYQDAFSIAASGNTTYDLSGSLTSPLSSVVFARTKLLLITADATNTNDVVVFNGTNPFVGPFDDGTLTCTLKPGGGILIWNPSATGWAVSNGSNDVIKLANSSSGSAVTGKIIALGAAS